MTFSLRVFFISLMFTGALWAGPPLLTDDPDTPGPGAWEVNIAATSASGGGDWFWELPVLDINYGVGENIQLKYEVPWVLADFEGASARSALGNSEVGIKWRFLDEETADWSVSIYPQYAFEALDSSIRRAVVEDGSEFLLPFQVGKTFGETFVYFEVGRAWLNVHDDEWIYGIAMEHEINESFKVLAEVHGIAVEDFSEDELILAAGFKWHWTEHVSLMGSAGRSVREPAGEPGITVLYLGFQCTF
jgi:hypothetical protein